MAQVDPFRFVAGGNLTDDADDDLSWASCTFFVRASHASEFDDDWLMAVYNPAKNFKSDATQAQGVSCRDESDSR
jgi:hypothetical protein